MTQDSSRETDQERAAQEIAASMKAGFQAIGRFLLEFSQLEFTLRFMVGRCLKIPDDLQNLVINYDYAMLCNVAKVVFSKTFPNEEQAIEKIINECFELNNSRVRVSHGLLTLGKDTIEAHHVARGAKEAKVFFENAKELHELADKAQALMGRLLELGQKR